MVIRTHIPQRALHLAGPLGPRPQILRTYSIAEPGCRLLRNARWMDMIGLEKIPDDTTSKPGISGPSVCVGEGRDIVEAAKSERTKMADNDYFGVLEAEPCKRPSPEQWSGDWTATARLLCACLPESRESVPFHVRGTAPYIRLLIGFGSCSFVPFLLRCSGYRAYLIL